ncbi:hypothetical protein F8144_43995 [Streptomyces triticiradicis]|uniref:Uncharacterized protein n=1 Tax=Streptomyces triticiradicis TaxID=2651189 RepID=A0A7J5D3U4_9ACTN|nr:hypothetical protein F8144_43995 [Streptomyces triticiradicis]
MWQEVPPLLFGDADDSFQGVIPPEYIPNRIVIPTLEEIRALKEVGSKALVVIIDLMSGCGHRNGEAFAANLEGMDGRGRRVPHHRADRAEDPPAFPAQAPQGR